MPDRDNGGSAFPSGRDDRYPLSSESGGPRRGITLRDYFAAKIIQGFAADPKLTGDMKIIAGVAYQWADAMLEARKK